MSYNRKSGFVQSPDTNSTHTLFDKLATEATQKDIVKAIESINISAEIGDITVESSDTITHEKLDVLNTTITNKHLSATEDSVNVSGSVNINNFPVMQSVEVSNFPSNQSVSVDNFPTSFEVSNFPATQTVEVSNFPSTQSVVGNFFQEVQPVSGEINIGNFPSTQNVSGSVSVSNFPATQNIVGTVAVPNGVEANITNAFLMVQGDFYPAVQEVSGTVSVASLPAISISNTSFDVSNFPATQTVSGSVSVSSLPAIGITNTSFDVGNFPETQNISGSVSVSNFPATQTVSGSVGVSSLPAISITNTSFDVGNFPATQNVSGSVSVSNFPTSQTVSGSVSVSNFPATQTVSGSVGVSSLPAIGITNTSFDVGNFPATQNVSGSVSVSNFPATQTVSGSVSANISNTSLNNNMYVSNNGTDWVHIKADSNGLLNVHSMLQDGDGNNIASTVISSKRALDVNIAGGSISVSSVNIKDSNGNNIIALTAPTNSAGSLKVVNYGTTNDAQITDTSTSYSGITKIGSDVFVSNDLTKPVIIGGTSNGTALQPIKTNTTGNLDIVGNINISNSPNVGLLSSANTIKIDQTSTNNVVALANNTIKIDQTSTNNVVALANNTIKIDQTSTNNVVALANNTIKISQSSTDNNIKITDGTNTATITTPKNETTKKGIDSNSYLLAYNTITATNNYLTSKPPNNGGATYALDTNAYACAYDAGNGSYKNVEMKEVDKSIFGSSGTYNGLNIYQIMPKIRSYNMSGANGGGNAATDTILGGSACTLLTTNANFGLQNPRTYYFNSAIAGRVIKYTYIDSTGNEQTTTLTCTNANTYYPTQTAIGINEFSLSGTNNNPGSSELVYLNVLTTGTYYLGAINAQRNHYNGVFTCPIGAIAMITSIDGALSTAQDIYYMNIWDASGNRTSFASYTMWNAGSNGVPNIRTAGGGEYGCLGRILKGGESVCFSSYSTAATYKTVYYNVLVKYL